MKDIGDAIKNFMQSEGGKALVNDTMGDLIRQQNEVKAKAREEILTFFANYINTNEGEEILQKECPTLWAILQDYEG